MVSPLHTGDSAGHIRRHLDRTVQFHCYLTETASRLQGSSGERSGPLKLHWQVPSRRNLERMNARANSSSVNGECLNIKPGRSSLTIPWIYNPHFITPLDLSHIMGSWRVEFEPTTLLVAEQPAITTAVTTAHTNVQALQAARYAVVYSYVFPRHILLA